MEQKVEVSTWRDHAACKGTFGELFYPPLQGERRSERRLREERAKRVCARCPVRVECLDQALRTKEITGVWGGLNEVERRGLLHATEGSGV